MMLLPGARNVDGGALQMGELTAHHCGADPASHGEERTHINGGGYQVRSAAQHFAVQELESTACNPLANPVAASVVVATTSIVIGNMVGSGVFLLPASLAAYGVYSLWGWVISTVGALLLARVFCRLSHRVPLAGRPLRLSTGSLR